MGITMDAVFAYIGLELHEFAQACVIYFVIPKGLSVNGTSLDRRSTPIKSFRRLQELP